MLGVGVDDGPHQDQAGAILRILRHRVGVEHHREASGVGDAGKHRDHFLVADQRMQIDDMAAVAWRSTGGADEGLDAGFGKHVGQVLLRHPQRLDGEKGIEDARDVGRGTGLQIAIAGHAVIFAFLGLQPFAHRTADAVGRCRARCHSQHRAFVGRGLARQQNEGIGHAEPALRLAGEGQHIDPGDVPLDAAQQRVHLGLAGARGEIAPP